MHELEVRNIISVGFYLQTNEAEFILRVDEHKITGGEGDIVSMILQNLILEKSFKITATLKGLFITHYVSKPQEMLKELQILDLLIETSTNRLMLLEVGYCTTESDLQYAK